MPISRPTIEAVRDNTDITQVIGQRVRLKRTGRSQVGLCPFHNERTASFQVRADRQRFNCFGCQENGDVFAFLMKMDGLSFVEAVTECANAAGITIQEETLTPQEVEQRKDRASLHDVCQEAAQWFHSQLLTTPAAAGAREYLANRGITDETIRYGTIGYAPDAWQGLIDHLNKQSFPTELAIRASLVRVSERSGKAYDVMRNRIILPIFDRRSRPIAFGGRALSADDPAKYMNSPESEIYDKSSTLYGLNWARGSIQRKNRAIVVEGYFDVLSLNQGGFPEAVATCGTALTPKQVQELKRNTDTVIALFDMDEAGLDAADRSLKLFLDEGVEARHLELPEGKDPDEFVRAQGGEALEKYIEKSVPLFELALRRAVGRNGSTSMGQSRSVQQIAPLLRKLPGVLQSQLLVRATNILGAHESTLRKAIGNPSTPASAPGPGGRWQGSKPLNQILWLLLNFPDDAAPVISEANLDLISQRSDVKHAILLLLDGYSINQVLDQVEDTDLRAILAAAAAHEGLFEPEQATDATKEIIKRLENSSIQVELGEIKHKMERLDYESDPNQLATLLARRQELQLALKNRGL